MSAHLPHVLAADRSGTSLTLSLVPKEDAPFGPIRARLTSILLGKNGAVLRAQLREVYQPHGPAGTRKPLTLEAYQHGRH